MHPCDERQPELEMDAVLCGCEETSKGSLEGMTLKPCTVKDVGRLAAVSTATVSRVINGSCTVSAKTTNRVLTAVSKLQFSPNAHAAQLGRENRGISKKRGYEVDRLAKHNCSAIF
jgi:hypothetical protein